MYKPMKSTVTNLAELNDYSVNNTLKGGQIDIIYTDFAWAFDKYSFNIGNCLISWIETFLKNRSQVVCINRVKSDEFCPTSSVPQGSVLSSPLFAMFMNDLPLWISCDSFFLADDVKFFTKIATVRDCIKL